MQHARRAPLLAFVLVLAALLHLPAIANENPALNESVVYIPLVTRSASDLTITQVEITQSVQNSTGSVPLVAGRPTVARIYAVVSGVAQVTNVVAEVSATRNGVALPNSPQRSAPRTVGTTVSRGSYASSFNIALPADWLSGNVQLSFVVDPANTIPEINELNNQVARTVSFVSVPALNITIVPIQYTHQPNGRTYPAPTIDTISSWIMRSYPISRINTSFRPVVSFSGDLRAGVEWERLLNLVTDIKQLDGAPNSRVYYALVPISNGSDRWFNSGIAGIGWIGWRAAVGLNLSGTDDAGMLAAHEIGHNLGRYHAPCGVSGDPRQVYPYTNGSIGPEVYGLDISRARVWSPVAPDNARDVMSYCRPQWFSDFTYQGLLNNQRANGAALANSGPGLLVRATLADNGAATLQPAYALLDVPLAPPATGSEYAIQLLDAAGAVLSTYPVAVLAADGPYQFDVEDHEHDHEHGADAFHRRITAVIPAPAGGVARMRLVRGAAVLDERALASLTDPLGVTAVATLEAAGQVTLTWSNPSIPALVRYTADGARWTTLGVDLLGGRVTLDPAVLGGGGRFEITPADGGAPLSLPNAIALADADAAPQVWIDAPNTLPSGAPLMALGAAVDHAGDSLTDLTWYLNGVAIGSDTALIVNDPAAGLQHLALVARDRAGRSARAEHTILVEAGR